MEQKNESDSKQELAALCTSIRQLVEQNKYEIAEVLIKEAMGKYPDAPEPHNLMGLVLEAKRDHLTAMRHFRAAYALDPTYLPAQNNLDHYGTFFSRGARAYDESDCPQKKKVDPYQVEYNIRGIGHLVKRMET
jgi:Tfp pilus assembly protein PilF